MKTNSNYFKVVGKTTEDKNVVAGIFKTFETHGVPLDSLFTACKTLDLVPCWISLYEEARSAGMAHDRILSKLQEAISDSYGKDWSDLVISRLDSKFKP